MSGQFPTTVEFSGWKVTSVQPTLVSVSHSLVRQARSRGGAQRWLIEAQYPPSLTRAQLAPIFAFALRQRGQYETFTVTPPALYAAPLGIATGTPVVKGASQTGRTVLTDGWTPSQDGIMLAGDFIKFAGHDKVYMITADADSDAAGNSSLTIEPALHASPADNETMVVASVPFTVAFAADVQEFTVSPPDFHDYKISFVEVI